MRCLESTCTRFLLHSEITGIFLRSQTEERVLSVDRNQITGENTFNGDHCEIEGNHESSKDEKVFWGYF